MRYGVFSGGKRIRPIIAIESAKACCGKIIEALPAAAAVELVHTYSLIHDDLPAMDNDDLRRGKPTCHKKYGQANAILAGDALLTLAFNILVKNSRPAIAVKMVEELSGAIGAEGMVMGQALDLEFQGKIKNRVLRYKVNILKTAKLFSAAAKMGGLAANAKAKEIKALGQFGLDFGLSFQMVDDSLDGEGHALVEVASLVKKAKNDLKVFGKRADRLKDIIEKLSNRIR